MQEQFPEDHLKGRPMSRKKSPQPTKHQKRRMRIQQIVAVAIALIIIASMIVQFIS